MVNKAFWQGKKIFVTGHTGFKGSWLSLWLSMMGAQVTGYALQPPTTPSLFELCTIKEDIISLIGDIRDSVLLTETMKKAKPDVVIHMAAQSLVRDSYLNPAETYAINVMGTVNLFEAVRCCDSVRAVVNVTTDKCYENKEWMWGYRENEAMGGYDPYSNSKACSELVTASYRDSFFNKNEYEKHGVALASARAGNVIGGGDWAKDRLLPDSLKSLSLGEKIRVRNPYATRPWQYVLDPLMGYLMLAEKLYKNGVAFAEGWNFGPSDDGARDVSWIVKEICSIWGEEKGFITDEGVHPHEANYLKLDCSKARQLLNWYPKQSLHSALEKIVLWHKAYLNNENIKNVTMKQISEYII